MPINMLIRLCAALCAIVLNPAMPVAAAEGDPVAGEALAFACLGCHGIEGYRNAYPSYRVPKLGGQRIGYLETALEAYRAGTRPHPTMQSQARTLTDQDMQDLLAWFATFGEAADLVTPEQVAGVEAAQVCVTCHGAGGADLQPVPPVLSGQYQDYLVHSLKDYQSGVRSGSVMSGFAAALSEADMELIAAFYASREGGLETIDDVDAGDGR